VKRSKEIADLLTPWAGLVIGIIALSVAHQYGSDGMFDDCLAVGRGALFVVSLLAIAATIAGAFVSWRVFNRPAEAPARKLIALVSVGASTFFALAMILPVLAAMMIPPCFQ
jgi:hypothetical protein